MANEFNIQATPTETTPETLEPLQVASMAFGPKRVKTPNMEVEQFDPITVQKALERQNAIYPSLGTMGVSIGVPSSEYGGCRHRRPGCG